MKQPKTLVEWCRWLLASAAVGVIAYLALRASPRLSELSWLPRWLAGWADRHGELRNVPAFAALALTLSVSLNVRWGCAVAAVVAVVVELAQLGLPRRVFDLADIWCSLAGVAVVAALALVVMFLRPRLTKAGASA